MLKVLQSGSFPFSSSSLTSSPPVPSSPAGAGLLGGSRLRPAVPQWWARSSASAVLPSGTQDLPAQLQPMPLAPSALSVWAVCAFLAVWGRAPEGSLMFYHGPQSPFSLLPPPGSRAPLPGQRSGLVFYCVTTPFSGLKLRPSYLPCLWLRSLHRPLPWLQSGACWPGLPSFLQLEGRCQVHGCHSYLWDFFPSCWHEILKFSNNQNSVILQMVLR